MKSEHTSCEQIIVAIICLICRAMDEDPLYYCCTNTEQNSVSITSRRCTQNMYAYCPSCLLSFIIIFSDSLIMQLYKHLNMLLLGLQFIYFPLLSVLSSLNLLMFLTHFLLLRTLNSPLFFLLFWSS